MKTGLGLYRKVRFAIALYNQFRFWWRKTLLGFDIANLFLQRVDKYSLLQILLKNGATIGTNSDVETGLVIHNCKDYSNLIVGSNCHIGKNCFFDLRNKVEIGNNVVISMQCTFITHIDISNSSLRYLYPSQSAAIIVNDNSYLGAKTLILMGVQLGESVFSAAGSVITSSVEPYTMVGGVPAKTVKKLN